MSKQWMIIAGLGNPGAAYRETYHNIGRLLLEELVRRHEALIGVPAQKSSHPFGGTRTISETIYLAPSSYMNESGPAIARALAYWHVPPERLTVLHDDVDIPLGLYRIAVGRGSAGHKGVASVIQALGSAEFRRVRIGIGVVPREKALDIVLCPIEADALAELSRVFDEIARAVFEKG